MTEDTELWSWKKIFGACAGFAALEIFDKAFDYVLYPFVLILLGAIHGAIVMTILSIIVSIVQLYWINWRKWNPIRMIEDLQGDTERIEKRIKESFFLKKIPLYILWKGGSGFIWLLKRSRAATFIVLSMFRGPFQAMVYILYMRDGNAKKPMQAWDWLLFSISVIIGNLTLTLGLEVFLVPIRFALETFKF